MSETKQEHTGLPGQQEAKRLGYSVYAYGGQKKAAFYTKDQLCLKVYKNGTAEIMANYKLIEIKTPNFSFPHPNFDLFEKQILAALAGVA